MIIADTSVWVDHLRQANLAFARVLREGRILLHPFVIGEIALGTPPGRAETLRFLASLPGAEVAYAEDVLRLIEAERLFGSGIGYVDAHLFASARLTPGASLWTRGRKLRAAAERLKVAAAI